MSRYDVYAIGNALVDYEFEVSVAELSRLGISKGVMTLIEESRHDQLVGELQGEKHKRACGGSAANTLIGVQQLGGKSFFSCKVAADEPGDFYFQDLKANGVDTNLASKPRDDGKTGKCLVMITPDADRTMNTFLGITGDVGPSELNTEALLASRFLYIEGYLASSPSAREAVLIARKEARRRNIPIALSLSDPNMVKYFADGIRAFIGDGVDLLFCNEAEALAFTETTDVFAAANKLRDHALAFVITRGAHGALAFDGDHFIETPTEPVKVRDTLGAGDMFAGAFLYARSQGWDFRRASQLANYAAGLVVSEFGPRLASQHLPSLRDKAKQLAKQK
ncbi:adenosine kinase [Permianibacter sp. IMCC34836]|uniref:adenosine kinase n=1 Tax=Permianibacter fluminis TaxID=2738515 RepID=UPI0015553E9B|nr:adenosine kinase [Permianibacter fluminis]NQD38160.1 adenosine kinase [Permianibacter fluminis]